MTRMKVAIDLTTEREDVLNLGMVAQRATSYIEMLNEPSQKLAIDLLACLVEKQELEKKVRNAEYLEKIQRGIDQIAEGRGVERDLIEVLDD